MTKAEQSYYIPEPSRWPLIAVTGAFLTVFGVALWVNSVGAGPWLVLTGAVVIAYLFFGWFGDVIDESMSGKYGEQVDASFRQGMVWFIISELFFFVSFFGTLYYLRNIAVPNLGGEGHLGTSNILWEGFKSSWPLVEQLPQQFNDSVTDKFVPAREAMGAGGVPAINTAILLSSGVTITWAHWGLKKDNQKQLVLGLALTIALGILFLSLQAYEYGHAYKELQLTLKSGVYGSTFYMLTGFHGLHVTIGTIMLIVILLRSMKGHFSSHNHFAFEAVAWYWHFVDVVWLALFIFVYWL